VEVNPYLLSLAPYALGLVLFSLIGYTLLLEKKQVLSILFLLCAVIGLWLGSYGKELEATQYVLPLSLIVLSAFLMLQVEFTMVGFALMAIVTGFFNGHDMGLSLHYEQSLLPYIGGLIACSILILLLVNKAQGLLTQRNGLYMIGGISCMVGIALLVLGQTA
jgi:hydrogenase/urease accessory protein HupE